MHYLILKLAVKILKPCVLLQKSCQIVGMIGLSVVFVDKRSKKYTIFLNQSAYFWSNLFRSLNSKEFAIRRFGGSRKDIAVQKYITGLKKIGFSENKHPIDFEALIRDYNF